MKEGEPRPGWSQYPFGFPDLPRGSDVTGAINNRAWKNRRGHFFVQGRPAEKKQTRKNGG